MFQSRFLESFYEPVGHPTDSVLIDGTDLRNSPLVDLVFDRGKKAFKASLGMIEKVPSVAGG